MLHLIITSNDKVTDWYDIEIFDHRLIGTGWWKPLNVTQMKNLSS